MEVSKTDLKNWQGMPHPPAWEGGGGKILGLGGGGLPIRGRVAFATEWVSIPLHGEGRDKGMERTSGGMKFREEFK